MSEENEPEATAVLAALSAYCCLQWPSRVSWRPVATCTPQVGDIADVDYPKSSLTDPQAAHGKPLRHSGGRCSRWVVLHEDQAFDLRILEADGHRLSNTRQDDRVIQLGDQRAVET